MRAFLAVPPDPAWAARVEERVRGLRPSLPSASWTRPESWHLTLRFFPEISVEAAQRCADETFRAAGVSAAELPTGGSVVFPPRGRPRVLGARFRALLRSLRARGAGGRGRGGRPRRRGGARGPGLPSARDARPNPSSLAARGRRAVPARGRRLGAAAVSRGRDRSLREPAGPVGSGAHAVADVRARSPAAGSRGVNPVNPVRIPSIPQPPRSSAWLTCSVPSPSRSCSSG